MRKKIHPYICKRKMVERETNKFKHISMANKHIYIESLQSHIAHFVYFQSLNFAGVSDMRASAEIYQGATPKDKMKGIFIKDLNDKYTSCI